MSYNNLSQYDFNFLKNLKSEIPSLEIIYMCSSLIEIRNDLPIKTKKLFIYNKINNKFFKIISYIKSNLKLIIYLFTFKPKFIQYQWIKITFIDIFTILIIKIFLQSTIIFTVHNARDRDTNPINLFIRFRPKAEIVLSIMTQLNLIDIYEIRKTIKDAKNLAPVPE